MSRPKVTDVGALHLREDEQKHLLFSLVVGNERKFTGWFEALPNLGINILG